MALKAPPIKAPEFGKSLTLKIVSKMKLENVYRKVVLAGFASNTKMMLIFLHDV